MTTGARPCFPVFDGVLSLRDSLLKVFILYLLCSSYEQRYRYLQKTHHQSWFCSPQSRLRVVIATVAFGIGINYPDVSQVIHLRSPCSLLNYAQESGRCGRDGRQAVAKLYYSNIVWDPVLPSLSGKKRSTNLTFVIFRK